VINPLAWRALKQNAIAQVKYILVVEINRAKMGSREITTFEAVFHAH
jgi:hypothetical protein